MMNTVRIVPLSVNSVPAKPTPTHHLETFPKVPATPPSIHPPPPWATVMLSVLNEHMMLRNPEQQDLQAAK